MAMFIPTAILVKDIPEKLPTRPGERALWGDDLGIG